MLRTLSFNKCRKSSVPESVQNLIAFEAALVIQKAYARTRFNPAFCLRKLETSRGEMCCFHICTYDVKTKRTLVSATTPHMVRCIMAMLRHIRENTWPPIKITVGAISAMLERPYLARPSDFTPWWDIRLGPEVPDEALKGVIEASTKILGRDGLAMIYRELRTECAAVAHDVAIELSSL